MKNQPLRVTLAQVTMSVVILLSVSNAAPTKLVHTQQIEFYLKFVKSAFKAIDNYQILSPAEIRNLNIEVQNKRKEFDIKFGETNAKYNERFNGLCYPGYYHTAIALGYLSNFATDAAFDKQDSQTREYLVVGIKKAEKGLKDCKKGK